MKKIEFNLSAPQGMSLRYLTTTRKYLLLSVGLGLLSMGMIFFMIIPEVQSVLAVVGKLKKEQELVTQLQKKVVELQQVSGSTAYAKADKVNAVMPSRKPLLELLGSLNTVVQDSQVVVKSIELSPGTIASQSASAENSAAPSSTRKKKTTTTAANRDYNELDVYLTIEGTLANINIFLEKVEKVAPVSTVTGLALSKPLKGGNDPQKSVFEAELIVTSFYFTKSVSAALEAPLPPVGTTEQAALDQIDTFALNTLRAPTVIQGGGLEDLFGVSSDAGAGANAGKAANSGTFGAFSNSDLVSQPASSSSPLTVPAEAFGEGEIPSGGTF